MPYVQFESIGDFIPKPKCLKFAVGLQMERRKMGGARGLVGLWSEGPRVTGAPLCAKCLNIYCSLGSLVVRIMCVVKLLWTDSPLWEKAHPLLLMKGMALQKRESVRMLSLVAHAVRYKMIVGAHNTVNVRCMWEVALSSSGMADVGVCHTVDA